MPQDARIFRTQVFRELPATFLGQVVALTTGELLTAADVGSIVSEVFDLEGEDPTAPISTTNVTVVPALHPLKLDARWTLDARGFNFDHTVPPNTFAVGGRTYALRYLFTAVGDLTPSAALVYHVTVLSIQG